MARSWLLGTRARQILWALLVAEAAILVVVNHPWMGGDSHNYLALGEELLNGRYGQIRDGAFVPETQHPPLYPLVLMGLVGLGTLPLVVVVSAQALMFLGSVYLVERLILRYSMQRAARLFLLVVLLCPATLAHSTMVMAEALSVLLLAAIGYLAGAPGQFTRRRLSAVALLSGLSVLSRPTLVALPVFLALAVALLLKAGASWRKVLAHEITFTAIVLVVVSPYALVNYRQLGRPTILPPGAALGYSIYASTWSLDGRVSSITDQSAFRADSDRINAGTQASTSGSSNANAAPGTQQAQETVQTSQAFLKEALSRVQRDPVPYAGHVVYNWWRLWNAADYPPFVPAGGRLLLVSVAGAVWALGMAGSGLLIWRRLRSGRATEHRLVIVAVLTLYFPLALAWLEGTARYAAPGQLFLHAAAGIAAAELWRLAAARYPWRPRRLRTPAVPTGSLTSG